MRSFFLSNLINFTTRRMFNGSTSFGTSIIAVVLLILGGRRAPFGGKIY
jgi:hypothetical protein